MNETELDEEYAVVLDCLCMNCGKGKTPTQKMYELSLATHQDGYMCCFCEMEFNFRKQQAALANRERKMFDIEGGKP